MTPAVPKLTVLIVWLLLSAAVCAVPAEWQQRWQSACVDAVAPGQQLMVAAGEHWRTSTASKSMSVPQTQSDGVAIAHERSSFDDQNERREKPDSNPVGKEATESAEQDRLRLVTRIEALQLQLARYRNSDPLTRSALRPDALVKYDTVAANLLGQAIGDAWRNRRMIGARGEDGVVEDSAVLADNRPMIDLGSDLGLDHDIPVVTGHHIVGRIAAVGRWSSTLQLTTDREFSQRVRIIRDTGDSVATIAEGTLVGSGTDHCFVRFVPMTAAVEPDDIVVSGELAAGSEASGSGQPGSAADRSAATGGGPFVFGKVVSVALEPAERHWSIVVRPAVKLDELRTVLVLRPRANPSRVTAN